MSAPWPWRLLARFFPDDERCRWRRELAADAAARVARERQRRGAAAALGLGARIAADLVAAAIAARRDLAAERVAATPAPSDSRTKRRPGMFEGLSLDLRDAVRTLRRGPAYAAAVVVTLALGIGATAAVFAVVHAVLLRPLPFADADRLVLLWESNPDRGWQAVQAAPANLLDWRERATSFAGVAGFSDWFDQQVVTSPGEPTPVRTMRVAGELFDVLGAQPALGRGFRFDETWGGGEPVAVLSHRLWRSRFGGDPAVVGRRVEIDRQPVTIVGVMPADFTLWSDETDLWRPFGWPPANRAKVSFRRAHSLRGVARLAPGVSLADARRELAGIAAALEREYPETNTRMSAGMTPLHEWIVGDLGRPVTLLFAAVALVLLIACVNVAHLQLARLAAARREHAVRGCLGADGWRLARRGLVESVVLSAIGAACGIALARLAVPALVRLGGDDLPRLGAIEVGGAVVGFALLLAAVAAFVAGAAPAWAVRSLRLERALRETGRGGTERLGGGRRELLVALQIALAAVLVAGSLQLGRSLAALGRVDPGFDPRGVLTAELALPPLAYPDPKAILALQSRLLERVLALPGVETAGFVSRLPATGHSWSSDFAVEGRASELFGVDVVHREASPGYFAAMRVPLVAGRLFDAGDDAESPPVVVINETLAREYFGDVDPIGLRLCFDRVPDATSYWYTVVGVIGDERQAGPGRPPRPEIFAPMAQDPNSNPRLVVRASVPAATLAGGVRAALAELDPRLPLIGVRTMENVVAESRARERFVVTLFAAFSLLALVLAAVGVYGVNSRAAAGRRREIGVRLALGAEPAAVVRAMVRAASRPLALGLAAGALGALALGRALAGLLYGVSPADPPSLTASAAVLAAVATLAAWLPARRAARVPPAEVLRAE